MKHNYLVSVFVGGKNVRSYYSDTLDELVTMKAVHKGCEISIFDLQNFVYLSKENVANEINRSGSRLRETLKGSSENQEGVVKKRKRGRKPKFPKAKKYWARPIMCVETGQVFSSIWKCSEHFKMSYKAIWNAINSGHARKGLHFMNAPIFPNCLSKL